MTKIPITNAEHPFRQSAIHIIEEIIEPLLMSKCGDEDGLNGEEYYRVEDDITNLIANHSSKNYGLRQNNTKRTAVRQK